MTDNLPSRRIRSVWTYEREAVLRWMWEEGASASDIAHATGATRSSVIGAAHRMHLPEHKNSSGNASLRARQRMSQSQQIRQERQITVNRSHATERKPDVPVLPDIKEDDIPLAQRRSLVELTTETCRWPCGDPREASFFFCGAKPASGKSYCAMHQHRSRRQ